MPRWSLLPLYFASDTRRVLVYRNRACPVSTAAKAAESTKLGVTATPAPDCEHWLFIKLENALPVNRVGHLA